MDYKNTVWHYIKSQGKCPVLAILFSESGIITSGQDFLLLNLCWLFPTTLLSYICLARASRSVCLQFCGLMLDWRSVTIWVCLPDLPEDGCNIWFVLFTRNLLYLPCPSKDDKAWPYNDCVQQPQVKFFWCWGFACAKVTWLLPNYFLNNG